MPTPIKPSRVSTVRSGPTVGQGGIDFVFSDTRNRGQCAPWNGERSAAGFRYYDGIRARRLLHPDVATQQYGPPRTNRQQQVGCPTSKAANRTTEKIRSEPHQRPLL